MSSIYIGIFCFALFVKQTVALVQLPQVDDNSILETEAVIRFITNTLFHELKLRDIARKPRLKEYSTVHNHLVSFTLQDYSTLKEVAKLTRVDKGKSNNRTQLFMTVINELLNEDVDVGKLEFPEDVNDKSVTKYVEQFLTTLETLKEEYGVAYKRYHINEEMYKVLVNDDVVFHNHSINKNNTSDVDGTKLLLQDSEFWTPYTESLNTRRIYRGDRTKIKYFPFMASIQIFNKFHCGGCIIKSDLIITASSCLQLAWNNRFFRENPAFLSVRVGSNFYNGGGENIPVLEVYFHPEYNPKNLWNNICILRLVRRINFRKKSRRVKKIDFDRNPSNLPVTTDGITVVGWGARGHSNIVRNPWENNLGFAVLDVYPLRECQDVYSREYVTHKNFCAGFFSKGGGACNRDVGGPGVVNGILAGIISFGSPVCGTPDAPTVFTKLGYYTDWIETIMEQEVPNVVQYTTLRPTFAFTLGQFYQPIQETTFKLPPLSGKLEPIDVNNVDALRILKNGNLFKEFLTTMFDAKDVAEYSDLLNAIRTPQKSEMQLAKVETQSQVADVSVIQPVTLAEPFTAFGPVTEIGNVDPDEKEDVKMHKFAKFEKDKHLEKDLVNLIDEIDLKDIISSLTSTEEDKLASDEKVKSLFKEKEMRDKMEKMDDSILTLLYLSDTEKGVNDNELMLSNDDNDDDESDKANGLSIDAKSFKDFTYRNNNHTIGNGIVREDELFDLISNVIKSEVNKMNKT